MNDLKNRIIKNCISNYSKIVIQDGYKALTYGELYKKSLSISQVILNSKVDKVCIYGKRNWELIVGIVGCVMAGVTYIPINEEIPAERMRAMLDDAGCEFIITNLECGIVLSKLDCESGISHYSIVDFNEIVNSQNECSCFENICTYGNNAVYILFTSGSTGRPKAVPISERNLLSYIDCMRDVLNLTSDDVLSNTFELIFDLSVFDIFITLSIGAKMVIISGIDRISPGRIIWEQKITVFFCVPSAAASIIRLDPDKKQFHSLRLSLFCGEALTKTVASQWKRLFPHSKCFNLYGPTELTISCSFHEFTELLNSENDNPFVPIGRMNRGCDFFLMDESGQFSNHCGELCVYGDQMFKGYLNDLNAFVTMPIGGKRVIAYRTKDVVELDNEGILHFKGRADNQIKINGYRVELFEIDRIVSLIEGVNSSITVFDSDSQSIAVFYSADKPCEEKIKNRIVSLTPKYMWPHYFIEIQDIKENINGKIDRKEYVKDLRNLIKSIKKTRYL